ncbi:MAG: HhH-GPD-type base excision DNA repair protein [Acidimicrobiia bacterium]
MKSGTLAITGNVDQDHLLNTEPLALLLGMLLDQQVPMEWAFRGPSTLRDRLGHLDAAQIAAMDPEALVAVFCDKPALHRYPAAMARRAHELCVHITDRYRGDAGKLWRSVKTGDVLFARLRDLPGYGDEKAQIFVAILAKRFGVRPSGWEAVAGPFADTTPRSVADVHDRASLGEVRSFKKAMKAAKRDKQGRPA